LRQGLLKELFMSETIGLDIGSHSIKLIGLKTLYKIKTSPAANSALAENVTTFTVT
jgi:Tfp pilus assembly PilM family ATPase